MIEKSSNFTTKVWYFCKIYIKYHSVVLLPQKCGTFDTCLGHYLPRVLPASGTTCTIAIYKIGINKTVIRDILLDTPIIYTFIIVQVVPEACSA